LLIMLRRFATESARDEARLFCDELLADDFVNTLDAHATVDAIGQIGRFEAYDELIAA
jgi:hypothetical protein